MSNASEELFDATARVERIIWIPGAVADPEDLPHVFKEEFCESLPERDDAPLYEALPILAACADSEEYPNPEEIAEKLLRTPGFLIQAATPVRQYHGDSEIYLSGWGYYHTEWLYAPSEAEILTALLKWSEETGEADKANSKAA